MTELAPRQLSPEQAPAGSGALLAGCTLLLVNACERTGRREARRLRELGCAVFCSSDPDQAIAIACGLPQLHVLVLDAGLASQGGLLEQLRIEHPGVATVMTGRARRERPGATAPLAATVIEAWRDAVAFPVRSAELIASLRRRMQLPEMLGLLSRWQRLRGCDPLPRPACAELLCGEHAGQCLLVRVEGSGEPPGLVVQWMGQQLTQWLGRSLRGADLLSGAGGDLVGLPAAHLRAARSRVPVYEWLRWTQADGNPVRFDRLALPLSEDGYATTHLLALALFSGRGSSAAQRHE